MPKCLDPRRDALRPLHALPTSCSALLFYALTRLGLDTKPDARPPQQQHIVLVNAEHVKQWQPRLWET